MICNIYSARNKLENFLKKEIYIHKYKVILENSERK